MKEPDCGGCKGQGAHSRRCRTNPGWFWFRLQDMASDLGDEIGSNDVTSANMAYAIAARMKDKAIGDIATGLNLDDPRHDANVVPCDDLP